MRRPSAIVSIVAVLALTQATAGSAVPSAALAFDASPEATLRVETNHLGQLFHVGTVGLSIEAGELATVHLNAHHYRLVRLMRLLGPSVLRIGGNSVDRLWWTSIGEPPPSWATSTSTPDELEGLHKLLRATGWRVLLGVDLGHFDPNRVADEARVAKRILGTSLFGIEIGNEPDDFGPGKQNLRPAGYGVAEYLHEAENYRQALSAAAPGVALYGPALSETNWLVRLGVSASFYAGITQHYYATGGCPNSPLPSASVPAPTAAGLLSPIVRNDENEILNKLTQVAATAGRTPYIGETNVVACDASPNAGPQLASALWALDWSLRAASTGVRSLSFHSQLGPCGVYNESPVCAVNLRGARSGNVQAQSEYYGLLAARQVEGGRFVPARLSASSPLPNLTTWATITRGHILRIVIDNLATAGPAQPVRISIPGYVSDSKEILSGSRAEARSGIALGMASITQNGLWRPKFKNDQHGRHVVRLFVRRASAVIITLRR